MAQDTTHTCTSRAAEGQERTNTPWVRRTGATQPTDRALSRGGTPRLAQLALHNPHIWANSLKPVCFLCFLLFWCPLLPFIETGTLKKYTKMVLYMKNEDFDLKYPLHGV